MDPDDQVFGLKIDTEQTDESAFSRADCGAGSCGLCGASATKTTRA